MIRTVFSAAAAAAAISLAGAAHAADARLSYGDLDLSRPDQARVLQQRIATAAQQRCAGEIETGTRLHSACEADTREALTAALPSATRIAYLGALKQPVPKMVASR